MADGMHMYLVVLDTAYGADGISFDSDAGKKAIETALEWAIANEEPFNLLRDGEVHARFNGINSYSILECTTKNKVR